MTYLPRGIAPELLISQVHNTMPYLFTGEPFADFLPAQILRTADAAAAAGASTLTHFEYFRLCLSAHYLTCATPVPTDVDNQIRRKLWPKELPLDIAIAMSTLVLNSRCWDFTQVSERWIAVPELGSLGGHQGEWFTVATAAYCALKPHTEAAALRQKLFNAIENEIDRHSEIFGHLLKTQDGLGCLKASASIAHNLGDLDRVMDLWDLGIEDPLRRFYKLSASPLDLNGNFRYLGRLWLAGELYKTPIDGSSMAQENHRHFALRKPKILRQDRSLLIPTGPFLDDWGKALGRFITQHAVPEEEIAEVIAALQHGQQRLPHTYGYRRALAGLFEIKPDLKTSIPLEPQAKFEMHWNAQALEHLDEIPSRAVI